MADGEFNVELARQAIIDELKKRADAQKKEELKAYTLRYFLGHDNFHDTFGVDLEKVFLARSVEEAILKMENYLRDNMKESEQPYSLLFWDPEDFAEFDFSDEQTLDDYLNGHIDDLLTNETFWIKELEMI